MNVGNYARLAWPGGLAILMGIYVYWASQQELVSSRPSSPGQYEVPDPVPIPGHRAIHSRLWDDPISTAYEHWKSLPKEERARQLNTVQDADVAPATGDAVLNLFLAGLRRMQEYLGTRRVERSDKLAAQMRKHRAELSDDTLCLPVFLPGGPYAEDKERRMRIRYAVVTALAESGYHLNYSRQLTYLVAKIYVRVSGGWQQREIVVPVKRYGLAGTVRLVFLSLRAWCFGDSVLSAC